LEAEVRRACSSYCAWWCEWSPNWKNTVNGNSDYVSRKRSGSV
jgi:hypothetical protein